MKTMKSYLGALAAVSLLLVAGAVSAAPIQGDVSFTGAWEPKAADGTTDVSIGAAAHIAIIGDVSVNNALGDFSGAAGTIATYNSFTFNPFEPIATLWSVVAGGTTFTFALENIENALQDEFNLVLRGTGTVTADGFEATTFKWSFSGDSTDAILTFSSVAFDQGVAVPEPSVIGLLGLGLIAMGAVGVRRRSATR